MTITLSTWLIIQSALGQIESGNNDYAVGQAKEISRYQIKPEIWKTFNFPTTLRIDQNVSWAITRHLLEGRISVFTKRTNRAPSYAEVYALWNAPSKFAKCNYQLNAMPKVIRERCRRFENLCAKYSK